MENIEVHSKNFLIRWVHTDQGGQLTWKVVPLKRSINFCVFVQQTSGNDTQTAAKDFVKTKGELSDRLARSGFVPLLKNDRFHRVDNKSPASGSAEVKGNQLLAFVFDNTFSISNSKNVQFSVNISGHVKPKHLTSTQTGIIEYQNVQPMALAAAAAGTALYHKPASIHSNGSNNSSPNTSAKTTPTHSLTTAHPHQLHVNINPQVSSSQAPQPQPQSQAGTASHTNSTASAASGPGSASSASSASVLRQRSSLTMHPSSSETSVNSLSTKTRSRRGSSSNGHSTGHSDSDTSTVRKRSRHNTLTSVNESEIMTSLDNRYVTGYMQKKRRKQYQGFAKRYFNLDRKTGLLNYYLNNKSSSLRGVMPVKISDIQADRKSLLISLDSGVEKWVLKLHDSKCFDQWCTQFRAVRTPPGGGRDEYSDGYTSTEIDTENDTEAQSTANEASTNEVSGSGGRGNGAGGAVNNDATEELQREIRKLRKRLSKTHNKLQLFAMNQSDERSRDLLLQISEGLADGSEITLSRNKTKNSVKNMFTKPTASLDDQCETTGMIVDLLFATVLVSTSFFLGGTVSFKRLLALLVTTFVSVLDRNNANGRCLRSSIVLNVTKFLHQPSTPQVQNEPLVNDTESIQVVSTEDDEDYLSGSEDEDKSPNRSVSYIPQIPGQTSTPSSPKSAAGTVTPGAHAGDGDADADVSADVSADAGTDVHVDAHDAHDVHASAETNLFPLPHVRTNRRDFIEGPSKPPPSLLAILKKSRDPSSMAAPITSNEPLSGLQYVAELFENSDLLDKAAHAPPQSVERMMWAALFAVSRCSGMRCKERVLRKPFTPLLGESYEMVREDLGFRYVCEKVQHKPEVIATQAESPLWTIHFTSRPHTKIWPKSVQLTDVGHVAINFPDGECLGYLNPEMFIRNIYAGERYVEPYGTTHIESNKFNLQAAIEFKSGGMFSGRSEEVKISCGQMQFDGKWTEGIYNGKTLVWQPKPLVANANKHYGWPKFAVQLNEITEIEENKLPPNDSRLRPDLRMYESQEVDIAEETKLKLEQHQRERRKHMEQNHKHHEPFFFVKSNDAKGHFILKKGDKNYWVRREAHNWDKIPNYFV